VTRIHPTAVVDPKAELGDGAELGPYAVLEAEVVVGPGTRIGPHAYIARWTRIGGDCYIGMGAALGGPPQDRKFHGERSYLVIGDRNQIREYVTIHRGSGAESSTIVGDDNMLMNYVHLGHNVTVGSGVNIANCTNLSGHAVVEDNAYLSGMCGIHQHVRIGKLAMVGGLSKVVQDVPPFMLVEGNPAKVMAPNVVGLRRAGFSTQTREAIKLAYRIIYRSERNMTEALAQVRHELSHSPEALYLVDFLEKIKQGASGRALEPSGPGRRGAGQELDPDASAEPSPGPGPEQSRGACPE
jgi:UDP-N-acetylglucosamine acyltransferase